MNRLSFVVTLFAQKFVEPQSVFSVISDSVLCGTSFSCDFLRSELGSQFPTYRIDPLISRPGLTVDAACREEFSQSRNGIILIELGSDDLLRGSSVVQFRKQYLQLLGNIREKSPDAQMIVVAVPDLVSWLGPHWNIDRNLVLNYNRVIQSAAKTYNALYLDLFSFSKKLSFQRGDLLSSDGMHPNLRGQRMLSNWIVNEVRLRVPSRHPNRRISVLYSNRML